jgi:LacI family transcriptional regulator
VKEETKLPTINDVADLAGVSKRTVSRVINGSSKVNKATRNNVQQIIEQLNFAPNRQARGLAARRSYLIGLIFDAPTLFINDIQRGMLKICEEAGYEVVVHSCQFESKTLVGDVIRFVQRANLDGVIVLPPMADLDELASRLEEVECQYIRYTSKIVGESWQLVVTDYLAAISDMTNHLVDLGHRDIGFISGPPAQVSAQRRHEIFVQTLDSHGLKLPRTMVAEGAFTYDSGVEAARDLLTRKRRPTAIFAASDEMAFGVMKVASEMGLRIPEDLSLIGFDGTKFSTFVIPSLSTIIRKSDEMSQLGTRKLLALINDGPEAAREFETMVSGHFIPRDSTGPVPDR